MDTQLVVIESDVPLADSRKVAFELGMEHKNFRELLQDKQSYIEKHFGFLRFTTAKLDGRGRPEKYVLLTEEQSYYALTFSENTPKAMELRAKLIKAFMEARQGLTQSPTLPLAGEWPDDIADDPRRLALAIKGERAKLTYLQTLKALRYPELITRGRPPIRLLSGPPTPEHIQSEIIRHLTRLGELTLNTLYNSYMKRHNREEVERQLALLVEEGRIYQTITAHSVKYFIPDKSITA